MSITSPTTVNARYMVDDIGAAVGGPLNTFTLLSNAAPAFADVTFGSLRLFEVDP